MRTRLASESGSTLIELVAATAVLGVVMGAVFGVFSGFERSARINENQNDSQDRARRGVSRLARDLRNMASPTPTQPQALEVAEAYDIVFQTVDPEGPNSGENTANVRRVRYCLDNENPRDASIWLQTQTWTSQGAPPMPSTATCPAVAWGDKELVAYGVTNRADGRNAPLWTYGSGPIAEVSSVRTELFVDANPDEAPSETRLQTAVFLRNQNRAPTAGFTATVTGSNHVLLNGWGSQDPEGEVLTYVWYSGGTEIGRGIELDWVAPSAGTYTLKLKVVDPAGLEDEAASKEVTIS